MEQLAADRPVYAIDLRGFGFSEQPDVPTGVSPPVSCLQAWMRQL